MRVLIFGAAGQVGSALRRRPPPDVHLQALTHAQCDIADPQAVQAVITAFRPDVVINAAAYTAVDRAEDEPDMAAAINAHGPANLARGVQTIPDCHLLHVSTDYVFDGQSASAYRPDDAPNPLSVYGRSKLAGEQAVREVLSQRAIILRTAWVYAAQGKNFLLTMLRLMRERGAVSVVADQRGSPTSADSIATALWAIARRPDLHGVLHWTDAGADSWFGFASAIAEEAHAAGLLTTPATVSAITTAQYPTRAHRPANSVLDTTATVAALGLAPAPWRENMRAVLQRIAMNSNGVN